MIEWGPERVRAGAWRGRSGIAYLAPVPGAPPLSTGFIGRCLETLRARGFVEVVTGALAPGEQRGFLAVGFEVREHLELLAHDLDLVPQPPLRAGWRLRRAWPGDRARVLAVDAAAFREFWQLDDKGLNEAISATPQARFRVVVAGGDVLAYAVSGRAGNQGYLQRLAVDPRLQRRGAGRALVIDGLRWMARHGARRALVNTQPDNHAALELYRSLGFRQQPAGLAVLARRLTA